MNAPISLPDDARQRAQIRRTLRRLLKVDPHRAGRIAGEMFRAVKRYPVSPKEQAVIDAAPHHVPLTTSRGRDFVLHHWDEQGEKVLLVHGWEQTAGRFVALIQALRDAGYAVYALDAPAHGASSGEAAALVDFMEATQAAVKYLDGVHAIIGHSLGGSAAMFALASLDGLKATRAVTIGAFDRVQVVFDAWIRGMGLPDAILPQMVRHYRQTYTVNSLDLMAEKHAANIHIPALIIHDRDDEVIPFACAENIARLWPDSRLIATDRLRHYLTLRNTAVIKAIMEFLAE